MAKNSGYTLLELLIAIVIVVIITGAIYYCMNSALESWSYSRDELSLQKVLSDTMDKLIVGNPGQFGLKDSLEMIAAGKERIEFVPPWVDNTHRIEGPNFIYGLERRVKPGASVPIAQAKPSGLTDWKLAPVILVEFRDVNTSQVKLGLSLSPGGELRFIYHPDAKAEPDVIRKIYWESDAKEVFMEGPEGKESLSQNFFGVQITKMALSYFTTSNELLTDRDWVDSGDIQLITGIEVLLEARVNERTQVLKSFVSLRNAPMRTGYLMLKRGLKIPIADSKHIHTLLITNISGVSNNDEIDVMAVPRVGKIWRLRVEFEKIGDTKPKVRRVTVEYPPQTPVYTDTPGTTVDLGVNLKILDSEGIYDYDDDEDVEDTVLLEGDVEFIVNEMTMKGAGLFVRP